MVQRNKAVSYALLALHEIVRQRRLKDSVGVRAADISEKHGLPQAYVSKVLCQMAQAGVLLSDRGPGGGYRLSRGPDQISLYEVLGSVGAWTPESQWRDGRPHLPRQMEQAVTSRYREANEHARNVFNRTMLADLVGES